jgi:uncharacterized protein YggU (UPF0235/DUF167 family)
MVASDDPSEEERARIALWVRPGSSRSTVAWDPWRKRWNVTLPAVARGGEANRALLRLLAEWLEVPESSVRLVVGGSSHAKVVEVYGLGLVEVIRRLGEASTGTDRPPPDRSALESRDP